MNLAARFETAQRELAALEKDINAQLRDLRDRRRGPLVRMLHEVQSIRDPLNAFASQAGQDRVIDRLYKGARDKTFIDVGAYDGVTGSNSLFFEKERGWTGICVEPVEAFRAQAQTRREAAILPYAVSEKDGTASFMAVTKGFTQMSGLVDQYDPEMLARVRDDVRHEEEEIEVETRTLSRILTEAGIEHPDFISLDIEGGELAVLSGFPFDLHRVGAWSIENNTAGSQINEVMRANGYKLVEYCGPDEVYAHNSLL